MPNLLEKSDKKTLKVVVFTRENTHQKSVILNIVTITEIYVLCVNDSELKRWSHKNNCIYIWEVGMHVADI